MERKEFSVYLDTLKESVEHVLKNYENIITDDMKSTPLLETFVHMHETIDRITKDVANIENDIELLEDCGFFINEQLTHLGTIAKPHHDVTLAEVEGSLKSL